MAFLPSFYEPIQATPVGLILPAGISVGLVLLGVIARDKFLRYRQIERGERKTRRFLKSIYFETDALYFRYLDAVGNIIENMDGSSKVISGNISGEEAEEEEEGEEEEESPSRYFNSLFEISGDYFIIYEECSELIGHLKDEDLQESIITLYTEAKGMLDSFRANNERVKAYMNARDKYKVTGDEAWEEIMKERENQLERHTGILIYQHNKVKKWFFKFKLKYADYMQENFPDEFDEDSYWQRIADHVDDLNPTNEVFETMLESTRKGYKD